MTEAISEARDYVRLRQICLAAEAAEPVESALRAVFGLEVSIRDERVARHGLVNFVMPLGTSFIELVAPTREGTAVGRFLERGGGGYMAIFDCSDLEAWHGRVVDAGVRVVQRRVYGPYENMHLHPRDTGAAMIELHHNEGGDALDGHYDPGGENWQDFVRCDIARDLLGIDIETPDPAARAALWGRILGRAPVPAGDALRIGLDYGFIDFRAPEAGGLEQLSRLHVSVIDPASVLEAARRHGLPVADGAFRLAGVWFRLHAA